MPRHLLAAQEAHKQETDDGAQHAQGRLTFAGRFAPSEGMVAPMEKPFREEICLNGKWQFQPVAVPRSYRRGTGTPPELGAPAATAWESVPLKVPSPWNVNAWGNGRQAGEGTKRPFAADSVYYPSYPEHWDGAEMGWLQRTFAVPAAWNGKRLMLHFEAVAGEAQVYINERLAGSHFDSFLPFDIDVTELAKAGQENSIRAGIRKSNLFNIVTPGYPEGQQRTYPNGSNMDNLVGIWNDVYLWALPEVRIDDVFVQPLVDEGTLRVEVVLHNDTASECAVVLDGEICPWTNLAGRDVLSAPEPRWKLEKAVVHAAPVRVTIPAKGDAHTTLSCTVKGELAKWTPAQPNLYGLTLRVRDKGNAQIDSKYTRFGWRQFQIKGRNLYLNGERLQLWGDFGHPFGPFVCSRRYVWQDYKTIKEMGGNSVRPHANAMPRHWLELADEMGLCVLDESSIFGSSISLNLKEPVTWERFRRHVDGLVQRDRNHPSVFGWSVANEMFALSLHTDKADHDADYAALRELARRPKKLDPTREWISIDGDQDLDGSLPVWSKHMGIGLPKEMPAIDKPRMIGEHGGTYYAAPPLLRAINGDRAYESYRGRNEGLAYDLYRMVTQVARPELAAFSASEIVWFGLEQLPFGYTATTRAPNLSDGVFFSGYSENVPGVQIERLPPYVTTLNPGFDPNLPGYRPLPLFEAMKAAIAGQQSPWAWFPALPPFQAAAPPAARKSVAFVGSTGGVLYQSLYAMGAPFLPEEKTEAADVLIVDGEMEGAGAHANEAARKVLQKGGLVWIMVRERGTALAGLKAVVTEEVQVTARQATGLTPGPQSAMAKAFSLADLYFAGETGDRRIQTAGLAGAFVSSGQVLLQASNTDWSLFERQGENVKCGAMLIYERLHKPAGAALVEKQVGGGRVWISTLNPSPNTAAFEAFWKRLWQMTGVTLAKPPLHWIVSPGRESTWRYSSDVPTGTWATSDFDDAAWKSGSGPFGVDEQGRKAGTPWQSSELFLRKTFTLDRVPPAAALVLLHGEDVEIYLNGQRVASERGGNGDYAHISLEPEALAALKRGENLLAVHCLKARNRHFADVGLATGAMPGEERRREHDLLLDGPK